MTVIRSARAAEGRFTQLANAMIRDNRLGLDTRALISYMLSFPPDARFTVDSLTKAVPNGRESVRRMLREAEKYGYFVRQRHRADGGRWQWEHVICDAPELLAPSPGNPSNGATCDDALFSQVAPSPGNPSYGEPGDKRTNTEPQTRKTSSRASGVRELGGANGQVLAPHPAVTREAV